jgi:hypothetical protein
MISNPEDAREAASWILKTFSKEDLSVSRPMTGVYIHLVGSIQILGDLTNPTRSVEVFRVDGSRIYWMHYPGGAFEIAPWALPELIT